jgi:hypothetical protein
MKPGIFFERDGILNVVRAERQHQVSPLTLEEFHVIVISCSQTWKPSLTRFFNCGR